MIRRMSRVVVIATGGTIATRADAEGVKRPSESGAQLISGMDAGYDVDVVDLMAVDSSQLVPADWDRIRAAVVEAAAGPGCRRHRRHPRHRHHGRDRTVARPHLRRVTRRSCSPARRAPPTQPMPTDRAICATRSTLAASPAARDLGVLVCFAGRCWQPLGLKKVGGPKLFSGHGRRWAWFATAGSPSPAPSSGPTSAR